MNVGILIKQYRTVKGYSVNKLANLAGISQSYLRDIELGKKNPTVDTLSYVCEALDISLADFFNEYCKQDSSVDSLMKEIFRLTPKQRKALEVFFQSIHSVEEKENPEH